MKRFATAVLVAFASLAIAIPAFAAEPVATRPDFADVPKDIWYESWVQQASELGYMSGKSPSTFNPDDNLTRAEAITVIYRAATGATAQDPVATANTTGLPDVVPGEFYTAAANWAVENGIMTGRVLPDGSSIFDPGALITRQDLATIIGRYAENCGTVNLMMDSSAFWNAKDSLRVADYAREPMYWTAYRDILSGSPADNGEIYLNPTSYATRAQMAKIIVQAIRWIPDQLITVESGFSVSNLTYSEGESRINYAFIAKNPNDDFSVSSLAAYSVAFYDAAGNFIASDNGYIGGGFRPGDTCADTGILDIPKSAQPARMEITIAPNPHYWKDGMFVEALSNSCFEILAANENAGEYSTTITGSFRNLSDVTKSYHEIVIVYRDNGEIVGGDWTNSGLTLPPGGIGTFDTYVSSLAPHHTSIDVYIQA